jgi:DNA (cytosine-5)-methyltransferase 1
MAFTFYGAVKEAPIYKISKKIRLIECFVGIGTQAMALRNLGANFERYRAYDVDKDAIKSYNAIHNTNFEPTDIRNVKGEDLGITEKDKYEYLLTYSFPCTDLSCSGVQAGMKKGSGTRSGLLWEVERLLTETKELPQVVVMENVIKVHNPKNMPDFQLWLNFLESKG